ncbi:MAG: SRPBCC family protein [Candidatus Acidoferrales bacterium]
MAGKAEKPLVESLAVLVSPERVWAALTSPRDLGQLLLGRVEMGAQPGARLVWHWGVWEKLAPGRRRYTWEGTVLEVVPGSTLVLGPAELPRGKRGGGPGPPPVVTLTVKGQRGAALVTVVQGAPARPGEKLEDYEHGWADFLLKLKTQLETENLEGEVWCRALVRATPAQVFRAWLSPAALAKLLPGKAKVQARVGGRFSWRHKLGKHEHTGAFLELKKNRGINFTWETTDPASEVALEAQPAPYGTLVSVHHTGLLGMNRGQLFGQRMFWRRLLERLRCYCAFKGKIKTAG